MANRKTIILGTVAGLIWSGLLLWGAARFVTLPVFTLMPTIMTAFLAPGLVALAMVARMAQRRFFDDDLIAGQAPTGAALTDQNVLTNTVEQLVLALCIWPAAAVLLAGKGPGVMVALGVSFALTRLIFWIGYHRAPALRAFGFAASFFPTALVALWAFWQLLFGFR